MRTSLCPLLMLSVPAPFKQQTSHILQTRNIRPGKLQYAQGLVVSKGQNQDWKAHLIDSLGTFYFVLPSAPWS